MVPNCVRRCQELPGQHLFQFLDDAGAAHDIDSTMVNDYLHRVMGQAFTAKDFRTWNATQRAVELLSAMAVPAGNERVCNACIVNVVKTIAAELRNTPAVCRKSYINPLAFVAWRSGHLRLTRHQRPHRAADWERRTLQFLRSCRSGQIRA